MAKVFFDRVQPASFAGIEFAVNMIEVIGGIRDHIHEFPHSDGGIPEKLGRKLYVIRMHAVFDEGILELPGNYPFGMNNLQAQCESGDTQTLVIPQLGSIQAYCRNWPRKWTWQVRSGEEADYEFVEDDVITSLDVFPSAVPSTPSMALQLGNFAAEAFLQQQRLAAAAAQVSPGFPLDLSQCSNIGLGLINSVKSAFNAVLAIRDQETLAGLVLQQKIAAANQYISQLDRALSIPLDANLLAAVRGMNKSLRALSANISGTVSPIKTYEVRTPMAVSAISAAVFGDTLHAMDILRMNPIENPFLVPAGTLVKYIAATGGGTSSSTTNPAARSFVGTAA